MPQEGEAFTTKEATELLQHIATNMITKEDVRVVVTDVVTEIVPPMIERLVPPMINKAKHEIMDYVDKKDREYRGELNLALQKEDGKVDAVISTMEDKAIIDEHRARQLKELSPFLQGT